MSGGPPPGGDQDVSGGLLATTILVTVLATVVVSLRMLTKIWIVKRVGWDDWTILLAFLGHPIGCALVITQIAYGFGRHKYYLTDHQFLEFEKYAYGEWLQTFATLMFTKVSICLFLLRIPVSKVFIRPLQAMVVILVVSNLILSLLWIFQCLPDLAEAWNTELPGYCLDKSQLEQIILSQAIISIISDFVLSAFPILILRKVQISFRSKVGLCSLMGLGVITGSFSIVRTVLNWQTETDDPTWLSIPCWYWRTWEVFFGIVAASLPTLRPGYAWFSTKVQTRLSGTSKNSLLPIPYGMSKITKPSEAHTAARTSESWEEVLPLQKIVSDRTADDDVERGYDQQLRAGSLEATSGGALPGDVNLSKTS
ncbi:hypothetical protein MMC18_003062 [Xylographa bjoerkii]|nr:hypothetical protein [Xylographa bjoerkii]